MPGATPRPVRPVRCPRPASAPPCPSCPRGVRRPRGLGARTLPARAAQPRLDGPAGALETAPVMNDHELCRRSASRENPTGGEPLPHERGYLLPQRCGQRGGYGSWAGGRPARQLTRRCQGQKLGCRGVDGLMVHVSLQSGAREGADKYVLFAHFLCERESANDQQRSLITVATEVNQGGYHRRLRASVRAARRRQSVTLDRGAGATRRLRACVTVARYV
jgi:hypothetical protein